MDAIRAWLEENGLGKYADAFVENEIDLDTLPALSESDLRELGLPMGPRKRALQAIAAMGAPRVASAGEHGADAPAEGVSLQAERRLVTVVFADLARSTELSRRLDPEDMQAFLERFYACCRAAVEDQGGQVSSYLGDGVLALFGYPVAHEDDAARAIAASLVIAAEVPAIGIGDSGAAGVRIGIDSGELVVAKDASGAPEGVGDALNYAARLQTIAGEGEAVVSERTRALAADRYEFGDAGRHDLKGFGRETVWRAMGPSRRGDPLNRRGRDRTSFIGRRDELELVGQCWAQARDGRGRAVLITGETGMGKSRMLRQFRAELADAPLRRLTLHASAQHANSAYFPVIDWLSREHAAAEEGAEALDRIEALLDTLGLARSGHAPVLGEFLAIDTSARYPPLGLDPEQMKARFLAIFFAALDRAAGDLPLWVAIEDMHWLDPSSVELVERLIDRLPERALFLTVTSRDGFPVSWMAKPQVAQVTLGRLARSDCARMLIDVSGGRELPRSFIDRVMEKSDGVPLFVEELARAAVGETRGAGPGDEAGPSPDVAIPSSLKSSLAARLDRLGETKRIVQIASVLGRMFSYRMIAEITDMLGDRLAAALSALEERGFLIGRGAPPEASYAFKHALIQDAAYDSLLMRDRRRIHAMIGEAMRGPLSRHVAATPEVVAWHFERAQKPELAVPYLERAGRQALARSANREAIAFFERALAAIAAVAPGRIPAETEIDIRIALCDALGASGSFARARQVLDAAGRLSEALGDDAGTATIRIHTCFVDCQRGALEAAIESGREALALAEALGDRELIVASTYALGESLQYAGQVIRAEQVLMAALPLLRGSLRRRKFGPTGETVVSFLSTLSTTCTLLGKFDEGQAYGAEACGIARETGQAYGLGFAYHGLAISHLDRGEVDTALEMLEIGMEVWRSNDASYLFPMVAAELGLCLAFKGRFAEARDTLSEVAERAREKGLPFFESLADANLAISHLRDGALAEAERHALTALELSQLHGHGLQQVSALRVLGAVRGAEAQTADEGADLLEQSIALSEQMGMLPQAARGRLRLGVLQACQGRGTAARASLGAAHAYLEASGMEFWRAPAAAALAELA